jgi:3-oxoacyl-[acyl-carrier protein] reductase
MELGLSEKVAIVTGASGGIGKTISMALAAEGARVALCARDKEALERTTVEIAKKGGKALPLPCDVTRPDQIRSAVERTLLAWERIDILVNNAGGPLHLSNFLELSDADWKEILDFNLLSTIRFCREVLPAMRRQKGGRIINIASVAGLQIEPKFPGYRVAKTAVLSLTKCLSMEFAKENILVNAVAPGAVWTPSWEKEAAHRAKTEKRPMEETARKMRKGVAESIPLGRMGTPEEVASLVVFLASARSEWITGSCFTVDGGSVKAVF